MKRAATHHVLGLYPAIGAGVLIAVSLLSQSGTVVGVATAGAVLLPLVLTVVTDHERGYRMRVLRGALSSAIMIGIVLAVLAVLVLSMGDIGPTNDL